MTWRALAIVSMLVACWLGWRDCRRPALKKQAAVECESPSPSSNRPSGSKSDEIEASAHATPATPTDGMTVRGFHVPGWAMHLLPQRGENLLAYRDRIVPLAQVALAPHRARVARGRDELAKAVNLDAKQQADLDAGIQETAREIQDRLLGAALGGDFSPQTFKPMTGVAVARDVLDIVVRANQRFVATLRDDQRVAMAAHPFDFGDYLVFATRWEDALGYTDK